MFSFLLLFKLSSFYLLLSIFRFLLDQFWFLLNHMSSVLQRWIVSGEKPGFVYSKCLFLEMKDWTRHGDIFRLPVDDEDILANIGPITQVSQPLTKHLKIELFLPPKIFGIKGRTVSLVVTKMTLVSPSLGSQGQFLIPNLHPEKVRKTLVWHFVTISHLQKKKWNQLSHISSWRLPLLSSWSNLEKNLLLPKKRDIAKPCSALGCEFGQGELFHPLSLQHTCAASNA